MSEPKRPLHAEVLRQLGFLDSRFLAKAACYFGGGTRMVLELGEYRESKDIDFLCADQAGYRAIRETASEKSLGHIARSPLVLAREVRMDQYGIRTRIGEGEAALKFEIVRESRIVLEGIRVAGIPVHCLARSSSFAEKFLANADRGLDASTLSRDLIDLAFMFEGWSEDDARAGYDMAVEAYGETVPRLLRAAMASFKGKHRSRCVEALAIEDSATLTRGLRGLAAFADRMATKR